MGRFERGVNGAPTRRARTEPRAAVCAHDARAWGRGARVLFKQTCARSVCAAHAHATVPYCNVARPG